MKIIALLSGVLASAFAWAATFLITDLSAQLLALFPPSNSQQLLAIILWHAIVALSLIGGIAAVFVPLLGGLILLAAAGSWVAIGLLVPAGFAPQVAIPIAFCGIGVIGAFGAIVRGMMRRMAEQRPSLEDMAREEALRLEPDTDLSLAVERKSERSPEPTFGGPDSSQPDAIQIAVRQPQAAAPAGLSGLFVANVATLMLLTLAVGVLFYTNVRSGQLAAAFSTLPFAPVESAAPVAAAPVATAPEETAPAPEMAAVEPRVPPPAPAAEAPPAEVQVSSAPLDVSAVPPATWGDPFAYCQAVQTVDMPDRRYSGPSLTEPIAKALGVPVSSPPDRAKWRCYEGAVLGCASFRGASCTLTPTTAEMIEYCLTHPNATDLEAPNGTWSCVETTPEIPSGASWPVDARGFLPGAWVEITPPGKPVTAG